MKSKQWMSVLMALALFALTLAPLTLVAQAATTQGVADLMASYSAKWNGFTAIAAADKDEKGADSLEIINAYQSLSNDAAKDALGTDTICNLIKLSYFYYNSTEGLNAANFSTRFLSTMATQKMKDAEVLARILNGNYGTDGTTTGTKITPTTKFAASPHKEAYAAFLSELAAKDDVTKSYVALYSISYQVNSSVPVNTILAKAFQMHAKYLADTEGLAKTDANLKSLQEYTALGAAFTNAFTLVREGLAALQSYDASGEALDASQLAGLDVKFKALPNYVLNTLGGMSATANFQIGTVNEKAIAPSHVRDVALISENIVALLDAMRTYSLEAPSSTAVKAIQKAANSIAAGTRNFIANSAYTARYEAISASYRSDARPARDEAIPSTEGYEKAKATTYSNFASKFFTNSALCTMEPLFKMISTLAIGDIGSLLYTNDMVNTLTGLNSTIHDLLLTELENAVGTGAMFEFAIGFLKAGGALPSPQILAEHLAEEEYAANSAKLSALEDWAEFDGADFDWGVTDRESFTKAAVAVLRPVLAMLDFFAATQDTFTDDAYKDFKTYGTYETAVIPLLEALGCRGVLSYDEYMDRVAALPPHVDNVTFGKQHDALGEAIVNPILNLLEDLAANPLPVILDLLPRLAYAEQSGDLDAFYTWKIDFFGFGDAEFIPFKSLQGLVDMLAPALSLTLEPIDWEYLAHLGNLNAQESVNGITVYKNFVVADRADVYSYLKAYLGKVLANDENATHLGDLITDAMGIQVSGADLVALRSAWNGKQPLKVLSGTFQIIKGLFSRSGGSDDSGNDSSSGSSISAGDFFRAFIVFLGESIKNHVLLPVKLVTGKVALR